MDAHSHQNLGNDNLLARDTDGVRLVLKWSLGICRCSMGAHPHQDLLVNLLENQFGVVLDDLRKYSGKCLVPANIS